MNLVFCVAGATVALAWSTNGLTTQHEMKAIIKQNVKKKKQENSKSYTL